MSGDLTSEMSAVTKKQMAQIARGLSKLSFGASLRAIVFDWVVIFAMASLSIHSDALGIPFFVVWPLAVLIIGGRQHALLILMHEGAHRRLARSAQLNDVMSDMFLAFPVFLVTRGYADHHTQHHIHLNTELDPDWHRKQGLAEWQFPMTKRSFFKVLGQYAIGFGVLEWWTLVTKFSGRQKIFARFCYYAAALGLVCWAGHWWYLIAYWFVPYVFVMLVFQRIRSVGEHFGLRRDHELNNARNIIGSRLEAAFINPHNVGYHLDHHLFPAVPFYNLPALHQGLSQFSQYRRWAHSNTSYLLPSQRSVLSDLMNEV